MADLFYDRLGYLDTGEIFETDSEGAPVRDPVAIINLAIIDDDAHALGMAFAAAPDLLKAAERAVIVLEGIATIRREGDAIDELQAAIEKARGH